MAMDGAGGSVLTPFEAEAYVEQLEIFDMKSIGNAKWLQQHEFLEKLNVQSHVNVQNGSDEFVMEHLISYDKVPILVHELLALEVWREQVYPLLVKINFVEKSTMTAYMVLYHEATVISLLEAIFFNKEAVEAAGDTVIDLSDYCYRRMAWLNSRPEYVEEIKKPKTAKEMLAESTQEQLDDQISNLPFDISTKAVGIMRYMIDHCAVLPLSCLTRLLNKHDVLVSLVPLITRNPWERTVGGKLEKYVDGNWAECEPSDRLKLTKPAGQVWLAIYTLMQDAECRGKYRWSTFNKNEVLRLRAHFNDVLMDQIPLLGELRRTLEELGLMEPPAPEASVVVEQLPEIKAHLLKVNAGKWQKLAEYQKKKVFCPDQKTMQQQAERLAATYDFDVLESLLPDDPKCNHHTCGEAATFRCSRCKSVWYCRRQCQVEDWKKHKKMCNMVVEATKDIEEEVKGGSSG